MNPIITMPTDLLDEIKKPENRQKAADLLTMIANVIEDNKDKSIPSKKKDDPKVYIAPADNDLRGDGYYHYSGKEDDHTIIAPDGSIQWAPFSCNHNEVAYENSLSEDDRIILMNERFNNNLMANKLADMCYDVFIMGLDYLTVARAHSMTPMIRHIDPSEKSKSIYEGNSDEIVNVFFDEDGNSN